LQYREIGNTGVRISALGYGAGRFGTDKDEYVELMRKAFDLGVNYYDTSNAYGESELVCAKALKGYRDKVYTSTKNSISVRTVENWWANLHASLLRLEVDCIDFYNIIHWLQYPVFDEFVVKGGIYEEALKAREKGLIRYLCCSTHDTSENVIKMIDSGIFTAITLQYNVLDQSMTEAISRAREKGVGIVVMQPLAGGALTAPAKDIQALLPGGSASSAEIGLRFVLSNPGVTCAISGMMSAEEVEENVRVCSREEPLSSEERSAMEQVIVEKEKLRDLYCTGCNYCNPCPQGVLIAWNFNYLNLHRIYGATEKAREMYAKLGDAAASKCIDCGVCVAKCPQEIAIPERLKEVDEALGEKK